MIVPMKKVTILVQSKDSAEAIERLRTLGEVHVQHQQPPKGGDVSALEEDLALIEQALGVLSAEEFSRNLKGHQEAKDTSDWKFSARHILDLRNRLNQLKDYALTLKNRIGLWERWGDFDPQIIQSMRNKNVYLRLYQIPIKEIDSLPSEVIVEEISTLGGMANCVVISRQEIEIPFKEVTLPEMGLEKMRTRLSEDARTEEEIKGQIRKHTCYRASLLRIKHSLEGELEFHQALKGMGQAGSLMYLRGYIPDDAVKTLAETSKREKWGIMISEPSGEDRVPTLIRNPRWVSLVKPVFKLIEVIPGYRELDISLWFLVFLSIFFGMLIGDAGYGLIFFSLTLFAQRKWGRKVGDKSVFILFYILSCCTVIWGILSGTFFGQEWLPHVVKPLIPALRSSKSLQTFCFLLGALHLSIAHLWRAIIKLPSRIALAEIGWISILWGAFFLARMLLLGDVFPTLGKWFFIVGIGLVIFFTSVNKNLLKGIGAGFGNLLLKLVNSFTDVVSYIRLFAVGLATVAIADAFNKMAIDVGYNSVITGIVASLILLLGHALNILLGPMSILVHGVRLNVLEFCSHLDIAWSGFSYRPLRRRKG